MMKSRIFNLANALTLFRFPAAPAILWLVLQLSAPPQVTPAWISEVIVVLMGVTLLTDLFDGMAARHYKIITNFGRIMDPVADSTFFMTLLFALSASPRFGEHFPIWFPILVLYREVAMHVLRRYAALKGIVLAAKVSGKAKMAVQSIGMAIFFLLLCGHDTNWLAVEESFLQKFVFWCGVVVVGVNLLSIIEYAREIPVLVEEWREKK